MKKADLAKFLSLPVEEITAEIPEIRNLLGVLNLALLENQNSLEIGLSEEITAIVNKNKIEELKTDLSESALQTLAVVLYKERATKAEIDFVRGVDSSRSIKSLQTRGIIESMQEKNRKVYFPTTETLRYVGITSVNDAKDFDEISVKLKTLISGEN